MNFGILKDKTNTSSEEVNMGGLHMLMSFLIAICDKINMTPAELIKISYDQKRQTEFLRELNVEQNKIIEHVHNKN